MNTIVSARHLRQEAREGQRTVARLRLLEDAGLALARARQLDEALDSALAAAAAFAAFEHAALLAPQDGTLLVRAARGAVVPRGSRLAARGAYAAVLKAPLKPLLRADVATPLLTGRNRSASDEWLLPLGWLGEAQGLLVLLSLHRVAAPDAGDLQSLAAFGAALAAALAPAPAAVLQAPPELDRLTARERQVLALLPRGLTNAAIGEAIGTAPGTAKIHVERILHKLGVADRTQAAVRAAQWGLSA